ncbi:MAG: ribosomal-processing cysteine protease Prp [Lachnospiraceae bacterium]|nr:ribosomal-processing cysteine protease Prp [Lachnospiraceae bacterium]
MIRIKVLKDADGCYRELSVTGHADSVPEDEYDLICCAVSVLTINTVNALEEFTGAEFQAEADEDGYMRIRFPEKPEADAVLLLDTLVLGLSDIAQQYSDYVEMEIKEE